MAEYQLTAAQEPCTVIRTADGACIPDDPANRDYAEYCQWLDDGGVPDPYVEPEPPEPPPPTPEQQLLFEHENRLLAIEGYPPITEADFAGKVAAK